jgi:alpha-mannosidase
MTPPKVVEKLERRLLKLAQWRYAEAAEVTLEAAMTQDHFRMPPASLPFTPAPVGSAWGEHWGTTWFRGQLTVPKELKGRRVYYRHVSFTDKLLWVNDQPFCGMNHKHDEALLLKSARGGESFQLHIEAYTGHPIPGADPYFPDMYTHQFCAFDPGVDPPIPLKASTLLYEREQTAAFYYNASVLLKTAKILDHNALRRATILDGLNAAMDRIPMNWATEEELEAAAKLANKQIAALLACKNAPTTPTVGIVGHCHIDIGWLWPVKESIRKAAKSFSSVLNLMEDYPELRFQQSQPVLYDMIEHHYPDLLPKIKKRVKEGRWEPNGGMWVEADCNLSGGESLVRQFLEGRKKTMELFGYKADTMWLPDVFGYAAALPQILKKCDIENFVTSKINWNDTNRFPYTTFWWEGIDGTTVFSHFINTTGEFSGYNAEVFPEVSQNTWNQVLHKDCQDATLSSVGWGDGGGGPTREICEHAARMGDLEGCLKTPWVNVSEFLKRLREQPGKKPRWVGELYLEYHRGTYTSQARTKRWNRKLELLLREVELYSALAMAAGLAYPAEALQRCWRTVLTNQFHDILPGTSIRAVYETTEIEYAAVNAELTSLRDAALDTIAAQFVPDTEGQAWAVANALSWGRDEVVVFPSGEHAGAVDAEGRSLPCQRVVGGLAVRVPAASLAIAPVALRKTGKNEGSVFAYSTKTLDTPHYRIAFDKAGKITSLLDKAHHREVVRTGMRLNDFYSAEDLPIYWDAWDIDRYYRDKIVKEDRLESREVVADGPLFLTLRSQYRIGQASTLIQEMTVYAHSRRIDFKNEVEWRERHTLLKVGFGVEVHAQRWRNEIQYGHAERTLHDNTSWDAAQFEVCAHKWVDLSEGAYGVALLNDCKYGHDSMDGMISLTLLKSALCPDEEADQGAHHFTYALLPHAGSFDVTTVVREAYALNVPMTLRRIAPAGGGTGILHRLCTVDNPNVVVEAVKKAEADDAVIVRLYEAGNTRGPATLTFDRAIKKVTECNLMEEKDMAVTYHAHQVQLAVRPFEIKTLKIYFK